MRALPVCCSSPSEFPWKKLDLDTYQKIPVDSSAPVFAFAHADRDYGRSHFLAFELPRANEAYQVTVASHLKPWQTFFPLVLFYDAAFKPIAILEGQDFRWHDKTWTENERLEAGMRIQPSDPARYMAVFTSESLVRAGRVRFVAKTVPLMGGISMRTGDSMAQVEPGATTGDVRIALKSTGQ